MQTALELAARGLGEVEPNPAVGCVIVKDGAVIGSGFHERFGGPHAEVNALADCAANGCDPAGATMYVTLEPCGHTGKTPPCSQAVIKANVARVVIASEDPTDLAGGGINQLKQAGIEVQVGLCRRQAEKLNAPFYKHARTGQPWVIVKWAQSLDGKMAWTNPPADGNWISNAQSRADVHRLRKRVQAILTGIDTVIADNPKLTARIDGETVDRPPLRVVLDSRLRMPWDCNLITIPDAPTMVITTVQTAQTEFAQVEKLTSSGVEVLEVSAADDRCDLGETLTLLAGRGIQQVLVEAGPRLTASFLKQTLADEVRLYIAPLILGRTGAADITGVLNTLNDCLKLKDVRIDTFGTDIRLCGLL